MADNRILNKKGSALDIIWYVVGAGLLGIFLFISHKVWTDAINGLSGTVGNSAEVNLSIQQGIRFLGMYDFMFLGGIAMIFITLFIISLLIPNSPAWWVVYFIASIVSVIVANIMRIAYAEIATNAELASGVTSMPIIHVIMTNLPIIMLLFIAIIVIITLAKGRGEMPR